ncbi:cell division protein FtsB [Fibrobacter sp. UWB15]|nr:cell division protein FtsB [Fibrobacter sp. UWB6]SMG33345.1 cell division protein FtsB [Fibrobacter sp. UWB15]
MEQLDVKKRFFWIILFTIVATIAIVISQLMFGKNSLKQQQKVTQDIAKYEAQIDSLKYAIDSCNIEIERLKNDSLYKENLLRTRFGMSRKGERVFQMVK